ncbi:GTP-binding protein TrmE N-terminus-domain-containing protein [Dichotomopilus funicola]|uniref:GTP-binding protein TrmE N-terminus-domain-containing protein n=1 Tax=Dichotomopilus funicola TaxID=1934379 RepID=A0AAN6VAZ7_9PEZI|nr:GTP-binding protein TrmE N-terminus-domain-containing protein [Dichotomopilus funicola]
MFRYALRRAFTQRQRGPNFVRAPFRAPFRAPTLPRSHRFIHDSSNDIPSIQGDISFTSNDTIYALSSGAGRAGIAVIRVSGPGCLDVYKGLCPAKPTPRPRYAGVRTLFEPEQADNKANGNVIDSEALVLYFPGPKTVTGEDVLELHVHGGTATVKAVLSAVRKTSPSGDVRYAEPGEFTKRAFINGRLDLAQVESLGDTLAAETEHQRRAAVRGTSGTLGATYDGWRETLLLARGEIEALIDFSEDQHFDESPVELLANVRKLVEEILDSIQLHKLGSQRSELLRNGIRIALLGPPNAGKSSLMNQIMGREASIVSSEAGTTRDIVEASLDIRGYLCAFADTAGIRTKTSNSSSTQADGITASSIGAIEQEGIRRARQKALDSDVIIVLASVEPTESGREYRISYDAETLRLAANAQQCIVAVNKADVVHHESLKRLIQDFKSTALTAIGGMRDVEPLTISCKAAAGVAADRGKNHDAGGIHALTEKLAQSFSQLTSLPDDMQHLLGVTERQNQLLGECEQHLRDFMGVAQKTDPLGGEPDVVLAAEHLRLAALPLASITGRGGSGDVEEVLGVIFEKYVRTTF